MKKFLIIIVFIILFLFFIIFLIVVEDDCGSDYDCTLVKFRSLSFETNKARSEII